MPCLCLITVPAVHDGPGEAQDGAGGWTPEAAETQVWQTGPGAPVPHPGGETEEKEGEEEKGENNKLHTELLYKWDLEGQFIVHVHTY